MTISPQIYHFNENDTNNENIDNEIINEDEEWLTQDEDEEWLTQDEDEFVADEIEISDDELLELITFFEIPLIVLPQLQIFINNEYDSDSENESDEFGFIDELGDFENLFE